jgi:hypothetical protein
LLKDVRQYAYVPTDTPKFQVQQLSYPHTDPKTFQNINQVQSEVPQQGRNQGKPAMLPATSRFTPALGSKDKFPSQGIMGFPRQSNMGPPPIPQRSHPHNTTDNVLAKNKSTNHFVPPPSRRQLQNTDTAIPIQSTSHHQLSNTASQRFFQIPPTSRGSESSLRSSAPNTAREHRMSFVPEGVVSQGFT